MRKIIILILTVLLFMQLFSFNVVADKSIHVFGRVTIDGQPIENIEIKIRNLNRGFEISVLTNSNGSYEGFTTTRDHEIIRVTAVLGNGTEKSFDFEVVASVVEYEVNFVLEGETSTFTVTGVITFFGGIFNSLIGLFTGDLTFEKLFWIGLLILVVIFLLRLLFPRRNGVSRSSTDNDTFIFIPSDTNTKVKRF